MTISPRSKLRLTLVEEVIPSVKRFAGNYNKNKISTVPHNTILHTLPYLARIVDDKIWLAKVEKFLGSGHNKHVA